MLKHFVQSLAHRKELTNISSCMTIICLPLGILFQPKGWAEKYLLTILEIIIVLFFTVSEKSGKKHSVIPVEFWENIDTKDLQAHFNYPKG